MFRIAIRLALALLVLGTTPAFAEEVDSARLARGQYLSRIMDCAGCHMPRGPDGAPIAEAGLSGGTVGFEIPGLGTFWPPNLTPDKTGLAGWSEAELVAAIRKGVRPDGRILAPVMPWPSFLYLTDEDAGALAAYLLSLPPAENQVPAPIGPGGAAPAPFYRVTLPKT
ncbi:MAG: c-type cytochrome [Proteobacteria bacterium]|nr:c-type cytochrome [Pseudomonadota bacterium]